MTINTTAVPGSPGIRMEDPPSSASASASSGQTQFQQMSGSSSSSASASSAKTGGGFMTATNPYSSLESLEEGAGGSKNGAGNGGAGEERSTPGVEGKGARMA